MRASTKLVFESKGKGKGNYKDKRKRKCKCIQCKCKCNCTKRTNDIQIFGVYNILMYSKGLIYTLFLYHWGNVNGATLLNRTHKGLIG